MSPTVRDRTQEFFATVESYQTLVSTSPPRINHRTTNESAKLSQNTIEKSKRIHGLADRITDDIEEARQKIIQLEQLAKLTSNFRDERPNIQKLMLTIKQDIDNLNTNLKSLSVFVNQSFNLPQTHNFVMHHQQLLKVLTTRYTELGKSFNKAREVSTNHLQRQKKQRESLGFGTHKSGHFRTVPLNRLQKRRSKGAKFADGTSSENEALLSNKDESGHFLVQSQSQTQLYQGPVYNEQRALEAEHIESQLTEVSRMLTQFAGLVHEQGETIITIDSNVQKSIEHVEGAIEQLQKYLASLSGNRWLMIKVFTVLIFFAIIFTVFVA